MCYIEYLVRVKMHFCRSSYILLIAGIERSEIQFYADRREVVDYAPRKRSSHDATK